MDDNHGSDIEVNIVDDDPVICALYQSLINEEPGFHCGHTYATCPTALAGIRQTMPHVILMDLNWPGISGFMCVQKMRDLGVFIPILILTSHDDDDQLFTSLCTGATGYLLKGLPPAELFAAIREAHAKGALMSTEIAKRTLNAFQNGLYNILSVQEQEILQSLSKGDTYKEISAKLLAPVHEVKHHIYNIYIKLADTSARRFSTEAGVDKCTDLDRDSNKPPKTIRDYT